MIYEVVATVQNLDTKEQYMAKVSYHADDAITAAHDVVNKLYQQRLDVTHIESSYPARYTTQPGKTYETQVPKGQMVAKLYRKEDKPIQKTTSETVH